MRMRNILLLTIIQLVILLKANDVDQKNCLILDGHNSCSCCKSGYRGPTCSVCQHCLTHNVPEGECIYYCETGYYGKTCDKECPETCADGNNGPNFCDRKNGLPVCVECFPGYYGKQCDQMCDTHCQRRTCYQTNGKCLNCSSNEFYGDHCRLPCNQGCVSGTCNRTGHCTDGCKFGFYGERCESLCGINCQQGKCTNHGYHAYNCTKGCHGGYWGTSCLEKCPNHCKECEQRSGRCKSCVENYVQKPETGACVKEGKPAVADGSNLVTIVIVVIVVIIILGIIILVIWKKRRRRHRDLGGRYAEEYGLLSRFSDDIRQPEDEPLIQLANYQGESEGVRNSGLVDLQIHDIQGTFFKTSIYNLVESKLKTNGHVTISGASGEGKTAMALMLGNDYKKKGYQLVFVTDLMKFKMERVTGRNTFCIFDDIFGSVRLSDTSKLKEVLLFIELYLLQAKEKTHQTDDTNDTESANRQQKEELNFMVVFTSKTYNLTSGMSKLREHKHFMNSSVVDVTAGDGYSQSDMEQIFLKHKEKHNINKDMPVEKICSLKMLTFGFPLLCKMYFQLLYSKGIDVLEFFLEPIEFLESEMTSIIESKNAKSAALILMMLCEDGLNVFHLENESGDTGDTMFENKVKKVLTLMKSLNRADIAEAAKLFQGTYFTKGDIMYFSHPAITYACAFVSFVIYPKFILSNASIKFLYERVHPVLSDLTTIDRKKNTILISQNYSDVISERLAEEIKKGEYSMTISHPILRNRDVVDNLFIKLQFPSVHFHESDNHKCFLHWAVHANSLYLIQKILKIETNFSPEEIQQACEACVACGNTLILNLLFERLATKITETVIINVALSVAYTGNNDMFKCLPINGQNPNLSSSLTSQGHNMLHAACVGGSKKIVESVSQWIDINSQDQNGQTAIMLAVINQMEEVVTFLGTNGANLAHTDKKGDTVFLLACQVGVRSIVQHLLPLCDINSPGQNGRTPIMMAASNGKKEVFDLLVTQRADLTLTDNYDDSVLHLACRGGNTYIVEHLLPSFDINSRGQNGWTPIMTAAISGKEEVFDLLVIKGADLTLTDNYGDTVFHLASWDGNTYIVEHLLPSFDINNRGMGGWTPVMNAAHSGKKKVFDLLVTTGADLTLIDSIGYTILHQACTGGNIDIVRHTLPLYDVNVKGWNSHTPLMMAVGEGQIDAVDFLVSNKADINLVDDDGDSLLHLASEDGNLAMVKHVLPFSDIHLKDKLGLTPLMLAILNGKFNVFQYLVDKGASLEVGDNVGDDVLTLAYRGGCKEIIQQLTPCGEEIRRIEKWTKLMYHVAFGQWNVLKKTQQDSPKLLQRDGFGDTLLHLACRGGNLQCVEYLLPSYDINVRGRYGWTPVMMAARCGHLDVLQCLISHKANLSLVSDKGEDVLCLARRGTNTDIVTFLLTLPDFSDTG